MPYYANIPDEFHRAFDPIRFFFIKQGHDPDIIAIDIYDEFNNVSTRQREYLNGGAKFDISNTVSKWFTNGVHNIKYATPDGIAYYDTFFVKEYAVIVAPGEPDEEYFSFWALNMISQFGESSNINPLRNTFLTERKRYKMYEGYPLELCVLNNLNSLTLAFDDPQIKDKLVPDYFWHFTVRMPATAATCSLIIPAHMPGAGTFTDEINYTHECEPAQPFYVRWVNKIAGYDYLMFSHNQIETVELSNVVSIRKNYENKFDVLSEKQNIGAETKRTIAVGATGLTRIEMDSVKDLMTSPFVEVYEKEYDRWIQIYYESAKFERDTFNELSDIEIEFLMPTLLTQF